MSTRRAEMYRVESVLYASMQDDSFSSISCREIYFLALPIVKQTPKGCWLEYYGYRKFVLAKARKRWASETKAAALDAFIARKKRQIKILEKQKEDAVMFLGMAVEQKGKEETIHCQVVPA